MDAKTFEEAKRNLEKLMDEAVESHEPVVITRDGKPAVVIVSLEDWKGERETDFLLRAPVNRDRLMRSIANADQKNYAKELSIDDLDRLIRASK